MLGQISYLIGSIFLILRPLIKLGQNIFIYKDKKRPIKYKMHKEPIEEEQGE